MLWTSSGPTTTSTEGPPYDAITLWDGEGPVAGVQQSNSPLQFWCFKRVNNLID